MGQGESKFDSSFVFAYVINPRKRFYLTLPPKDYFESDPILTRPDIYALGPQNLSCITENLSLSSLRKDQKSYDSGYMSYFSDENGQLLKDLAYVDYNYYPTRKSLTITNEDNGNINTDKKNCLEISLADVVLASPDRALNEVYLPNRSIHSLSVNIGVLTMIRKLDLSNNHLTEIPESVGCMKNLESLLLAKNRLKTLPDTICYLSNLLELDVSFNELTDLTPCIGYLEKLKTLKLTSNQISKLPTEIRALVSLTTLELGHNPLCSLPAEISKLPNLRRMRLDECPLNTDISYTLEHSPPSLLELCARTVITKKVALDHKALPKHLIDYIGSAKSCTSCLGPYFESFVLRGRLLEKADAYVPLEYTLCSSHWIDEEDRICSMFSSQSANSHDSVLLPKCPSLPDQPHTVQKLSPMPKRAYSPVNMLCQSIDSAEAVVGSGHFHATSSMKLASEKQCGKSSLSRIAAKLKRPSIPW